MGCWNHTCFLSNLSISAGEEMALMTLIQTHPEMGECRPTEYYFPAPVMIYGKYDDYGGMEDCHGTEIEYLMQEFFDAHTLKEGTSVEEFTRLGDQGGLYFSDINTFHKKLKGERNAGIPVQHVAIKMSVLNRFLDQYHFTSYHVKDDNDKYVPINYEFLCNLIPAYIEKLKEHITDELSGFLLVHEPVPQIEWKDADILGQWLQSFTKDVGQDFYRQSFIDRLHALTKNDDVEGLTSLLEEFCKYMLIFSYMNYSRRVYIRPQCSSQETDPIAHVLMAEITLDVVEQQRIEWEEDEFSDDAWDPKRELYMKQCELNF